MTSYKLKLLSLLMVLCMLLGSFTVFAYADEDETSSSDTSSTEETASTNEETSDDGEESTDEEDEEELTIDYVHTNYATKEQKLASMELKLENRSGYNMYVDSLSGEIAVENCTTGEVLFSNPYDVAGSAASENVKTQLLSQIILRYNDGTTDVDMYSYVEAALRGQITVKNIKNGLRVEYAMGRTETRKLVPRMIEKTRMEEQIIAYFSTETPEEAFYLEKLKSFYVLQDPNDEDLSEREKNEMSNQYPITKTKYGDGYMAVYVLDTEITEKYLNLLESYIKFYCPHYTYEELENDHALVNYVGNEESPPLFRMALEYTLDEYGLSVRLPANGIRFDASAYTLEYIKILPYFNAGATENDGYTFIPDGSGTITRFEDIANGGSARTIMGSLYGSDYAYHTITGANQQIMRLPVFGMVENYDQKVTVKELKSDEQLAEEGITVPEEGDPGYAAFDTSVLYNTSTQMVQEDRGFVAIITEGDALASIVTDHGGNVLHKYNSVYAQVNPRPSDEYNLSSSDGEGGVWTVVSDRKYTGNYTIRYIMLTDSEKAEECGLDDYYECSYVGMAEAYRDYLVNNGKITALEDTGDDIPLYIETLGVMDSEDTFLTIPVTKKTPLTTFDDLKSMYSDLKENGITNVNFKLTGYINGGLKSTVPYNIKFSSKVGGNSGYKDFLAFAEENNIGVFPEFELSYAEKTGGGFSYSSAVKTIDNRYTQKREYDAVSQSFKNTGMVCISPDSFAGIFESLSKKLDKLGAIGISVSSLGSDLTSDFNSDDAHNREDAKEYVMDTLNSIKEKYENVMIDAGNAYALEYANHVLNVSLDGSHYTYASEVVPFFGLVYHGYINYAGTATNTASDVEYEILKMIENGANPYFILSYRNSEKLKEDTTGLASEYYSVRYDIWLEDIIEVYNTVNDAIGSLQTSTIVGHEFLIGERVPTDEEKAADEAAAQAAAEYLAEYNAALEKEQARVNALEDLRAASEGRTPVYNPIASVPGMSAPETATVYGGNRGDAKDYNYTKYTSDNGMIVRVTYSDGTSFILNYNTFDVTVDGQVIAARNFIKVTD